MSELIDNIGKKLRREWLIDKIRKQKGELSYEKISQVEFDDLIYLLAQNHPIESLSFSKCIETRKRQVDVGNPGYNPSGFLLDDYDGYDHVNEVTEEIPALSEDKFARFVGTLPMNQHLRRLTITSYRFTTNDAKLLAKILLDNRTLTHIDLSKSVIEDFGAMILRKILLHNDTIIELNINLKYNNHGTGNSIVRLFKINEFYFKKLRREIMMNLENHQIPLGPADIK